jgi:hypothetical protein
MATITATSAPYPIFTGMRPPSQNKAKAAQSSPKHKNYKPLNHKHYYTGLPPLPKERINLLIV